MKFYRLRSRQFRFLQASALLALVILAACGAGAPAVTSEVAPTAVINTDVIPAAEPSPTTVLPTVTVNTDTTAVSGTSFSQDVLPILQANCTRCHGSSRQSGGLRLDSYDRLMAGSEDGAVVLAGNAGGSLLVELITRGTMPKNASKLSNTAIQAITAWIDGGALDD